MKRTWTKPSQADMWHIDLTPLIDVVFVILILFILISPMIQVERIHLAQGGQNTCATPFQQEGILIHILSDNTIKINGILMPEAKLEACLKRLHSVEQSSKPTLFCDKNCSFGYFQKVKSSVENAGYTEMDVVLSP